MDRQPIFAYVAVLFLVAGTAAAIPNLVCAFANTASRAVEKLLGVEALLAMRSLRASLGRTSVLTAALATAVAMSASVGIMVGSFRETVSVWMNSELKADFYLRPAGSAAADRHPTMNASIANQLERLPASPPSTVSEPIRSRTREYLPRSRVARVAAARAFFPARIAIPFSPNCPRAITP